MKRAWLALLFIGCPAGESPPPKPPAPPPVVVVPPPALPPPPSDAPPPPPPEPPPPPPEPPAPPPVPPKPDSVKLVVFPLRLVVPLETTSYLCVAWQFKNGHVAMSADDVFRNIKAYDQTCDVAFRRWFDPKERQVTAEEQAEANYRTQLVGWRGGDSLVVGVQTLKGGILPHALQLAKWQAWAESNPRKTHAYDSTRVFARYGDQEAAAWVIVRSSGWYVAP